MTGRDNSPSPVPASPHHPLGDGLDARLFVWGVWIVTVALTFLFAYRSRPFPYSDDWTIVAKISEPATLGWLWAPHVGHRIVVPKLVFLALYNSSVGYDFRAGVLVNVALLSACAFVLMFAAKDVRGYTSYSDAFFPLALLNSGGGILWNFHLQFVCASVIATMILSVIVRHGSCTTPLSSLGVGSGLALLPLCGLNGLVLVPALALWLGYSAIRRHQISASDLIAIAYAVVSVLLCLLYLVGYHSSAPGLASPGLKATVNTAVAFLSASFGTPFSTYLDRWPYWRLLLPALLVITALVVGASAWKMRESRPRAVGLLLFLVAFVSLALAVGIGRGGRPWDGLDSHYGTAALPVLCWLYFVSELHLSRTASRLAGMSLFALMCGTFALSTAEAIEWSGSVRKAASVIAEDIRAGMQPCELAEAHMRQFFFLDTAGTRNLVVAGLRGLHRVNAGPFQLLRDDQADIACKWNLVPGDHRRPPTAVSIPSP